MAHFARIDSDNIVREIIVVANDVIENKDFPASEPIGIAFLQSLFGENTGWKQTSYSSSFRGTYAGIGWSYDPTADVFLAPIVKE